VRRTSATGAERLAPRPCGITQNVQAWSQPFWTGTKARVWCAEGARGGGHLPARGVELGAVGDHPVHFVHRGKAGGVDGGRAAGHDQAGLGMVAAQAAHRAARLADGLRGNGAGIDHDRVPAVGFEQGANRSLSARFIRHPSVTT
jgi:hypothetical protein